MSTQILERAGKPNLAYVYTPPSDSGKRWPLVMFCGGWRSDMAGTKATYLEEQCRARGQGYVRFDYSGHGESDGKFEDGTIGSWAQDALDVLDHITRDPVVLVGSSMGGWIALLAARARSGIIHGVVGIAAAPDFTQEIYYERLDQDQRYQLDQKGFVELPNDYSDEPYYFTKAFFEEAQNNLLLDRGLQVDFPVHLIQGMQDKDVPWQTAVRIQNSLGGESVDITFVDDGDHRLSRPEDLALIDKEVRSLSGA